MLSDPSGQRNLPTGPLASPSSPPAAGAVHEPPNRAPEEPGWKRPTTGTEVVLSGAETTKPQSRRRRRRSQPVDGSTMLTPSLYAPGKIRWKTGPGPSNADWLVWAVVGPRAFVQLPRFL